MKKIYFIRHAKALKLAKGELDIQRELSSRGKDDIKLMAQVLQSQSAKPEAIYSSPARRAKDTAKRFIEAMQLEQKAVICEALYEASAKELLDFVLDLAEKEIFIIGHNPAITEVCELISNSVLDSIPTCGIFCVELGDGELSSYAKPIFYDYPKKHKV